MKIELLDGRGAVRACVASDTPVHPVDTETINVQAIWEQPAAAAFGRRRNASRRARRIGRTRRWWWRTRRGCAPPPKDACTGAMPAADAGRRTRVAVDAAEPVDLQPGQYTVRLTVDGQTYTQPVTVKPDPRGVPE